ncbi:DUF3619 family protein [Xylophilus rhododendri]|jgi:hypothetical protein|uniref:DUF3619 family protein n=1 Tax=Xylophilus rhododendri TaxID=2697032 RepID=A0A857IZ85_9BURK|nr:DUF3619 family protein [Xylophilus rhododendri]QHI96904.1 DUF3619 family protein [Xylophilus rhododendri]
MNRSTTITQAHLQDEFGERVAARLEQGARGLPQDIGARLKAMRLHAVSRRKVANVRARTASAVFGNGGGTATLSMGGSGPGFWGRLASALPLLALVGGLVAIHVFQTEDRLRELAEVDSDLLTDDLPPSAYTDPGFIEFLKHGLQKTER